MVSLKQLFEWFTTGKFPSEAQFAEQFKSFWHKSEKLPQTQVLGLNDALDDKATKDELQSAIGGLIPMGDAIDLNDLETKPKRPNDSYFVLDQLDENGNPYIFRYDAELGKWINTKQVVYKNVATKDEIAVLEHFKLIQNADFIAAYVDSENRVLWGIKRNGVIYVPKEKIPTEILRGLADKISYSDIQQLVSESDLPISAKAVMQYVDESIQQLNLAISLIEDSQFLYTIVDRNYRILQGFKKSGKAYFPTQELLYKTQSDEFVYYIVDSENKILWGIRKDGSIYNVNSVDIFKVSSNNNSLFLLTDKNERILIQVKENGNVYIPKLELPQSTLEEISKLIQSYVSGTVSTDHSKADKVYIPFPTTLCRVNVIGDVLKISAKNQELEVELEFTDFAGNYFKKRAIISWQGSSSLMYVIKNYSIDLLNDDDDGFDVKFGDWVYMDSFHLKVNYIDAMQNRNIGTCRIVQEMSKSRTPQYAYQKPYAYDWRGLANADGSGEFLEQRFNTGARCVVDGFPIELYINNEYHGLYTWNIKKNRDNYQMSKSNPNHILAELGSDGGEVYLKMPVNWSQLEVRNPKGLKTEDGSKYDYENATKRILTSDPSVDANSAQVRASLERFFDWAGNCKNDVADTKYNFLTTYKDYIDLPYWIDWMLIKALAHAYDCDVKNTLVATWDGKIWTPHIYDLDTTYGSHWNGSYIQNAPTINPSNIEIQNIEKVIKDVAQDEINKRYKELRDNGTFKLSNLMQIFNSFSDIIGVDAYKKHFKKWAEIPSNREENINGEYWTYSLYKSDLPLWDADTQYTKNTIVRMAGVHLFAFHALQASKGQKPVKNLYPHEPNVRGWYGSNKQIESWLSERLNYLDGIYNY